MSATLEIPKPTHREQLPIRTCRNCGCYLRTGNESTQCTPCGTPPWEIVEPDLFEHIGEIEDVRCRRCAFDAVVELAERA